MKKDSVASVLLKSAGYVILFLGLQFVAVFFAQIVIALFLPQGDTELMASMLENTFIKMNSEIMTLLGCFQSSEAKGKIQYGPAWWFLDNKPGMEKHLVDLTATGHLATFVGMLTDSRSLLSYPRHQDRKSTRLNSSHAT